MPTPSFANRNRARALRALALADVGPVHARSTSMPPTTRTKARRVLVDRFGHENFQKGQWEPISAVLDGHDALVVMPTGSGKSLVYQLPALMLPGLTVVVSPLIALMKDQQDKLARARRRRAGDALASHRRRGARARRSGSRRRRRDPLSHARAIQGSRILRAAAHAHGQPVRRSTKRTA